MSLSKKRRLYYLQRAEEELEAQRQFMVNRYNSFIKNKYRDHCDLQSFIASQVSEEKHKYNIIWRRMVKHIIKLYTKE